MSTPPPPQWKILIVHLIDSTVNDDFYIKKLFLSQFAQKVSHSQLCIFLFGDFELLVSACYGHHHTPLKNMNIATLLSEGEDLPLHSGAKIYSIVYV
jgi:hypothetical protein